MTRTTHILLQATVGAIHTFVGYPGLHLPVELSAALHAVLAGANVVIAALAHGYNTDGTPQEVGFVKGEGTGKGTGDGK